MQVSTTLPAAYSANKKWSMAGFAALESMIEPPFFVIEKWRFFL